MDECEVDGPSTEKDSDDGCHEAPCTSRRHHEDAVKERIGVRIVVGARRRINEAVEQRVDTCLRADESEKQSTPANLISAFRLDGFSWIIMAPGGIQNIISFISSEIDFARWLTISGRQSE